MILMGTAFGIIFPLGMVLGVCGVSGVDAIFIPGGSCLTSPDYFRLFDRAGMSPFRSSVLLSPCWPTSSVTLIKVVNSARMPTPRSQTG